MWNIITKGALLWYWYHSLGANTDFTHQGGSLWETRLSSISALAERPLWHCLRLVFEERSIVSLSLWNFWDKKHNPKSNQLIGKWVEIDISNQIASCYGKEQYYIFERSSNRTTWCLRLYNQFTFLLNVFLRWFMKKNPLFLFRMWES